MAHSYTKNVQTLSTKNICVSIVMVIESLVCVALSDFAKEVMILRQEGVTKHALTQLVKANQRPNYLTVGIIDIAYKQPIEQVEQHKLNAVTQFSSRVYQACNTRGYYAKTQQETGTSANHGL